LSSAREKRVNEQPMNGKRPFLEGRDGKRELTHQYLRKGEDSVTSVQGEKKGGRKKCGKWRALIGRP